MFEVYLAPDAGDEGLLTEETIHDTKAQVMTTEEAAATGFSPVPDAPPERERRLIIVGKIDERRIQNALEASPKVAGFRVHFADR